MTAPRAYGALSGDGAKIDNVKLPAGLLLWVMIIPMLLVTKVVNASNGRYGAGIQS